MIVSSSRLLSSALEVLDGAFGAASSDEKVSGLFILCGSCMSCYVHSILNTTLDRQPR